MLKPFAVARVFFEKLGGAIIATTVSVGAGCASHPASTTGAAATGAMYAGAGGSNPSHTGAGGSGSTSAAGGTIASGEGGALSAAGGMNAAGGAVSSGGTSTSGGAVGAAGATASGGGSSSSAVSFPLSVSSDGRYLQDSKGVPFPILGDAGWEAPHNTNPAGQQVYLQDRTSRGFNSVLTITIDHKSTLNKPPQDFAGNLPFTKRLDGQSYTGSPNGTTSANGTSLQFAADPYSNVSAQAPDFSYPTSAYWTQLDAFVSLCASKGVAVFMFPAYVGYGGGDEGWMSEMTANDAVIGVGGFGAQPWSNASKSKLWNYGAWLAQHYASTPNIVWVLGGDFGTSSSGAFSAAQSQAVSNLLVGMKSVAGQQSHLWTAHWGRPSLATDIAQFSGAMDLESVYVNAAAATQTRGGYSAAPAKPTFEIEDYYEGDPAGGGEPNRRYQWWSFLGGIAGEFTGNEAFWPFATNWQAQLASQGAKDMAQLNSFVRSVPWQTLVPSGLNGQKAVVTTNGGTAGNADYIACADSGSLGVCYVPPGWSLGTFTVDSTVMSAPYRARWLNPTSGVFSPAASNVANTGTHVFTPPGNNGSPFTDWVLVLDIVAGAPPNAPPTVATPALATLNSGMTGAALSVLGSDDGGEANLSYSWAVNGTPPAAVSFSVNASNAAKNAIATFSKAGSYSLEVTISDAQAASTTSDVGLVVSQLLQAVSVGPATASIQTGGTQSFVAIGSDQFGAALAPQPTFTWSVNGGGTVSASGLFSAGSAPGGPFSVSAVSGPGKGIASINVTAVAAITPIQIGQSTILGIDDSNNGSWLIAQQTTLSRSASIQSLSFYVAVPSGKVRLGVYDATGPDGGPGAKLAESAEITVSAAGWVSAPVSSSVVLPAGTYWLAYLSSDNGLHSRRTGAGGGACQYYVFPYGPLPAVFSPSATSDNVQWSLYATLLP